MEKGSALLYVCDFVLIVCICQSSKDNRDDGWNLLFVHWPMVGAASRNLNKVVCD